MPGFSYFWAKLRLFPNLEQQNAKSGFPDFPSSVGTLLSLHINHWLTFTTPTNAITLCATWTLEVLLLHHLHWWNHDNKMLVKEIVPSQFAIDKSLFHKYYFLMRSHSTWLPSKSLMTTSIFAFKVLYFFHSNDLFVYVKVCNHQTFDKKKALCPQVAPSSVPSQSKQTKASYSFIIEDVLSGACWATNTHIQQPNWSTRDSFLNNQYTHTTAQHSHQWPLPE